MVIRSPTLRQVLDTTEQLTVEIGCQNTTLQEIINRSGISKGAIYHYVQSKDELFGMILQEHMGIKIAAHGHPGAASAGSGEAPHPFAGNKLGPVSVIVKGLLQPADHKQTVLRRCFIYLLSKREQPDVAKILNGLHQNWVDFMAGWIKQSQLRGLIPSTVNPDKTAALIISILFGLMVQKSITEDQTLAAEASLDPASVLDLIARMLELDTDH